MDISLENIDIIRERTNLSYREAKEVLVKANGDIVEALIAIESDSDINWTDNVNERATEILNKLRRLIEKGNITRIILKKDDDIILNIPVTAGAIGVILSPIISIFGISAALVNKATIEIIEDDGNIIDLNEFTMEKMEEFKNRFSKEDIDGAGSYDDF